MTDEQPITHQEVSAGIPQKSKAIENEIRFGAFRRDMTDGFQDQYDNSTVTNAPAEKPKEAVIETIVKEEEAAA